MTKFLLSTLFAFGIATSGALAETKDLGKHKDWHAYKKDDVCYMVSLAKSSKGNYTKRGDVYAVVAHRPNQNTKDTLSFHAGYPFGKGAQVKLTIKAGAGDKTETLFTEGETAWCVDSKTDTKLVNYMAQKGSKMIIQGQSARGTETTDEFSLSGMLSAYNAIGKACNITG